MGQCVSNIGFCCRPHAASRRQARAEPWWLRISWARPGPRESWARLAREAHQPRSFHVIQWQALLLLRFFLESTTCRSIVIGSIGPASSSSFVTKWASCISRGRFDLESQHFTGTFAPVGPQLHRIWHHYMLPVGSYRRSKKGRKWRRRHLQPRITKIGIYIYAAISWSAIPDMMSQTTSGRKLKLKKHSKMPLLTALGQILVAPSFASPHQLLFFFVDYMQSFPVGRYLVYKQIHDSENRMEAHTWTKRWTTWIVATNSSGWRLCTVHYSWLLNKSTGKQTVDGHSDLCRICLIIVYNKVNSS